MGQCVQIACILKGAYNIHPPKPCYSNTWKVNALWLLGWTILISELFLMELSIKTVLLLALTRPLRSVDLASFQLANIRYLPEGVIIIATPHLPKQSCIGNIFRSHFVHSASTSAAADAGISISGILEATG